MPRTVLIVAALVAATALLVSTGAYPLSDGTDEVSGVDIELSPAEGPNGDYALLNEDDEIELLLTGANPDIEGEGLPADTRTPIDRVFTVRNTGDTEAAVWITDDADDVRFYRGDDPGDDLEGPANEVTVDPNGTIAVGLLVDTRGEHDVEQASGFSVHVEQATEEQVSEPGPSEPETSEPVPSEPDTSEPETSEPETSEPESGSAPTPEPDTTETPTAPSTSTTEERSTTAIRTTAAPAAQTPADSETETDTTGTVAATGQSETTPEGTTVTATATPASESAPDGGITDSIPAEIGGFGAGSVFALVLLLALTALLLYANRRRRG